MEAREQRIVFQLVFVALCSFLFVVLVGVFSAFYYVPVISEFLKRLNLTMQMLRPLHTSFAIAWVYIGAIAVVYHFLIDSDPDKKLSHIEVKRYWIQQTLWLAAGFGILVTLMAGIYSGREYIGFHPAFSLLIIGGWIFFAWNFFSRIRKGFWEKPVYVYMWSFGVGYFFYSFAEAHSWLLPWVSSYPVVDLQMQWKSMGSMVGSFNHMVYGCVLYVAVKLTGNKAIAYSKSAFLLFGISALNSLTNYGHHTYHLPQYELIKWVSFVVSMLEAVILVNVLFVVWAELRRPGRPWRKDIPSGFFLTAREWTIVNLVLALVISIPPLNALIHGTHVVVAHSMGTMIGIDTFILLAVISWLIREHVFDGRNEDVVTLNFLRRTQSLSLFFLVVSLSVAGSVTGVSRYLGGQPEIWVKKLTWFALSTFGTILAVSFFALLWKWLPKVWLEVRRVESRRPIKAMTSLASTATASHSLRRTE